MMVLEETWHEKLSRAVMSDTQRITQFDLEYFFELSPDLLCVWGFDGHFKKINPSAIASLGHSHKDLYSQSIVSLVHPEDRELTLRKWEALKSGEVLFHFENRFLKPDGSTIWLSWTAVPIVRDELIFAIARDITAYKKSENQRHVLEILKNLNTEQMQKFSAELDILRSATPADQSNLKWIGGDLPVLPKDQLWLNDFEKIVKRYAGTLNISLAAVSAEMAISERQLFREVNRIIGVTPNKLIRIIRLHLAWEAIASKKHRTIREIAMIAGFTSQTHFKKLFRQVYGIDVAELL